MDHHRHMKPRFPDPRDVAERKALAARPPTPMKRFAETRKIHPAIAAEVCNRDAGKEVFAYSYLRMRNLIPAISDDVFRMWMK